MTPYAASSSPTMNQKKKKMTMKMVMTYSPGFMKPKFKKWKSLGKRIFLESLLFFNPCPMV